MTSKTYNFNKIITRLFILIAIGVTAHMIYLLNTTEKGTFSKLSKIDVWHLAGISLFALGPWIGHTLRIYIWSRFVGHALSLRHSLSVVISNDVGSSVVPTLIGGGPLKYGMLVAKGMPSTKATFLVLLSATEDIVFYAAGFFCTFFFMSENLSAIGNALSALKWPVIVTVSIPIFVVALLKLKIISPEFLKKVLSEKTYKRLNLFWEKIKKYFKEIGEAYKQVFRHGKKYLAVSIFLLFSQWFSKFTILAFILHALGVNFTLFAVYIKQWIIWVGLLIVPTPGGSGGAEAAFMLLFKESLPGELPSLVLSTWRFFTYYYILFLAVIIFNFVNKKEDRELTVEK